MARLDLRVVHLPSGPVDPRAEESQALSLGHTSGSVALVWGSIGMTLECASLATVGELRAAARALLDTPIRAARESGPDGALSEHALAVAIGRLPAGPERERAWALARQPGELRLRNVMPARTRWRSLARVGPREWRLLLGDWTQTKFTH